MLKGFLASELLQYTGTALVMPWEVGKVLLQIQWIPRDAEGSETEGSRVVEEDEVCTCVDRRSSSGLMCPFS